MTWNSPQSTEPISARFPALEEPEVVLTFHAPDACLVEVDGSFNGWNPQANPLEHSVAGEWSVGLMLKSGLYKSVRLERHVGRRPEGHAAHRHSGEVH